MITLTNLNTIYYYIIRVFQGACSIIIYASLKLVPALLTYWTQVSLEKSIGKDYSWVIAALVFFVSFWLYAILILFLFQDRYDFDSKWILNLKPRKYTKKYGIDFKRPTFEEFGLRDEDYYKFNRQFRFDSNFIFNIGLIITAISFLSYSSKRFHDNDYLILVIGIVLSATVKVICDLVNKSKDNKSPILERIKSYKLALKIWRKIGEENDDKFRI